jgi:hypothetical protein
MMKKMSMRRNPQGECQPVRPAIMDNVMRNPVPKPACDQPADRSERDIERKQASHWDKE